MDTEVILLALVLVAAGLYYRNERKKLERLIKSDLNIYIYVAPEDGIAPSLDVLSDEVLQKKEKAQWN